MKKPKKVAIAIIFGLIYLQSFSQTGNCLEFDGIDDYVLIGDVNDLSTSDFTIEAWVNVHNSSGVGHEVLNKGISSVGTPPNAGYGLRTFDNELGTDIDFHIGHSDGSLKFVAFNGIMTNAWYHIAGVRSGKYLNLYLNGTLVASDSTSIVYDVDTDLPLSIGAVHKGGLSSTNEFMNGKIDEVRIWNRALSDSEINLNKDCAITTPQPNLVAVYNFNLGTGIMAIDSSGNDNHGSLEDGPIWIDSPVAPSCITSVKDDFNQNFINVYPNPFKTKIFIDKELNGLQFKVFDLLGRLTGIGYIEHNTITLDHLLSGNYILEILIKDQPIRKIIIKE